MLRQVSVVKEALAASKVRGVHGIHTPTEGGVINGLLEASEASGLGFRVHARDLLVAPETRAVCEALSVDPMRLLSSGALLITVDPSRAGEVLRALDGVGVKARVIGEVTEGPTRHIVAEDGSAVSVGGVDQDELYRVLDEST
jgi:hydrogenase maturation factor